MGTGKTARRAADVEHELTGKAATQRHRKPVALLGTASEAADQPPLVFISLVTLGTGIVLRRPPLARTGARMLLAHALATGGKTVLKRTIDRTRPRRALADGEHRAEKNSGARDTDLNSFPSGHTAGAVAVAQAVSAEVPALAVPARGAATAVGATQLPYGKHYVSDVLAGAAIGWLSEKLAAWIIAGGERAIRVTRERRAEQRALRETEAHPS